MMDTSITKTTTTEKACTEKRIKAMRFIGMILIMAILFTMPVFASANYGEKGGTWILDQVFWVGLVVVSVMVIKLFLSQNFTKMLITGAVGALVLVVIKNPQRLQTLGDAIWAASFGA